MALFLEEIGRFLLLFLMEDVLYVMFSITLAAENISSGISGRSRIYLPLSLNPSTFENIY